MINKKLLNNTIIYQDNCNDNECSICLGEFENGDKMIKLNCAHNKNPETTVYHTFHTDCLYKLFTLNNSKKCPLCKGQITEDMFDTDNSK